MKPKSKKRLKQSDDSSYSVGSSLKRIKHDDNSFSQNTPIGESNSPDSNQSAENADSDWETTSVRAIALDCAYVNLRGTDLR